MRDVDVLVLGDANPDLILSRSSFEGVGGQREIAVDDARLTVGGSGAIFACGAARLGLRVGFIGVVGDDLFGTYLRERLRERGVDVSGLITTDRATGVSVVLSSPRDRGTFTFAGAIAALRADDVPDGALASARHVHVSSFFLQESLRPGLRPLLRRARDSGATTSLDPNWDPSEGWDGDLIPVLEHVDVFLPNEGEVTRITRCDDVEEAARTLAERAGTVVVKLGGAGALAVHDGATTRHPGFPVGIADTTGAGDSFDAGFVRGFVERWPLERGLALANACGALSCLAVGGVDAQPTFEDAIALAEAPASGGSLGG